MKFTQYLIYILAICTIAACTTPETDTFERFYFEHDGAALAVQVDGNRASRIFILLLHGGPGGSGQEYNAGQYARDLEAQYAMVYLDQRGQGASQGSYDASTITLQQFSDDIEALCIFLKAKYGNDISLFLMGHSWGGTTGTHALLHTDIQQQLRGWIEVAGAHDIPLLNKEAIKMFRTIGNEQVALGNSVDRWQPIIDFAASVDTNNITVDQGGQINSYGFEAEGLIPDIANGGASAADHGLGISPIAPLATLVGTQTASQIHDETEQTALTNRLNELYLPCAFLWGKYDFVVPPALGETAFERVSTSRKQLVIFDQSGHSPMDNEPDAFVQAVVDFVEEYK